MYQVYTHPKYIEYGKEFFKGVDEHYTEYAKQLEPKIGVPYTVITPLIFILVRASVHYALFEDEYYLKGQLEVLKQAFLLFHKQYLEHNQSPPQIDIIITQRSRPEEDSPLFRFFIQNS